MSRRKKTNHTSLIKKVKQNQIRMIEDRGYHIGDELNKYETFDILKFRQYLDDRDSDEYLLGKMNKIYTHKITRKKAQVIYIDKEYLKADTGKNISTYIDKIIKEKNASPLLSHPITGVDTFIFISEYNVDKEQVNAIESLLASIPIVQFFIFPELYKHTPSARWVPEHILLSILEARLLLKNNNWSLQDLPMIANNDPMTKHLGALPGSIFMILREKIDIPGMINKGIYYRAVSSNSMETIDDKDDKR